MRVHYDSKMVFLETPKTGTRAVHSALDEIGFVVELAGNPRLRNESPKYGRYSHHLPLDHKLSPDWLVFSAVRNPYDLLVSWYFHIKRGNKYQGNFGIKFVKHLLYSLYTEKYFPDKNSLFGLHSEYTDVFIHQEDLEKELNEVLIQRGLPAVELEKRGVESKRDRDYRKYYEGNGSFVDFVRRQFKRDFEDHAYTF